MTKKDNKTNIFLLRRIMNHPHEDNEPLIELNNTTDEDFHNIVDAEGWDSEDAGLVIAK
jgi:hypothetical protein